MGIAQPYPEKEKKGVTKMKIRMFEETHEKDLQDEVNEFLKKLSDDQIVDIKYQMAMVPECYFLNDDGEYEEIDETTYSFSAMVIYKDI